MLHLLRRPLTYLVLGEGLVLLALGVAIWNLIPHSPPRSQAVLTPAQPEPAAAPTAEAVPGLPTAAPAHPSASPRAPGTGTGPGTASRDPRFWSDRLATLNRDQAALQKNQWRLIDAALGAARRYLDTVVVPAVEQAQRGHHPQAPSGAG